jgi:hypothetical protein
MNNSSSSIPIYWISYIDEGDYQRPNRLKKKLNRLEKTLPNKSHIIKHKNLDIREAHLKAINQALLNKENEIIIIEDKTSFTNLNYFIDITRNTLFKEELADDLILHLGGYLEDKLNLEQNLEPHLENNLDIKDVNENMNITVNNKWINGKSRSYFGYCLNLKSSLLSNLMKSFSLNNIDLKNIIYQYSARMFNYPLIVPYGYDIDKGLMKTTYNGLSMVEFVEGDKDISLKFNKITDENLPRITLLTILTDHRLWWSLIRLNLDNFEYPTQKIKWIILETNPSSYSIEDLLPKKRGTNGGWELEYIKKDLTNDFNKISENERFMMVSRMLKEDNKINSDFIVEFNPQCYYPVYSILSRVKTLLKYPNMNLAGCTSLQLYNLNNDKSYLIGDDSNIKSDFIEGSRIIKITNLDKDNNNNNINTNINLNQKIRIPSQFVSYLIKTNQDNKEINNYKSILYNKNDKFPDFLENEEFFADVITILDSTVKCLN